MLDTMASAEKMFIIILPQEAELGTLSSSSGSSKVLLLILSDLHC